jgi:hypothetical protein
MQPVSRERLGKHIPMANNTHATKEEPVSKQRIGKHKSKGIVGNGVFIRSVQGGYKEEFSGE